MEKKGSVGSLMFLLVLIVILIGAIVVFSDVNIMGTENKVVSQNDNQDSEEYVDLGMKIEEIQMNDGESSISSGNNNQIVTDRFVRNLDKESNMIVKTADGSMYVVKSGTVLVDDRIITVNDEKKEVFYTQEPAKSVSSN